MNFSIYIDDKLGKELVELSSNLHQPKNQIIRDAIKKYIHDMRQAAWSQDILDFKGGTEVNFESYRKEMKTTSEGFLE